MASLREAGALGFSDDGLPIRSARVLRRALQYQRLCGGTIALHEEDPELSGDGVMHEGPVSAALGLEGIPSVSESTMIARDAALAGYEGGRIHVQHLSAAESVEAVRAAKAAGRADQLRGLAAPPLPHRRGGAQPRPAPLQDEPAAALRGRPPGADRGAARRHDRLHRHRPRPARGGGKGGPLRAGGDGRDRPGDGLRRAAHRARPARACSTSACWSSGWPAAPSPSSIERPSLAPGSEANIALCDLGAEWTVGEDGYESRSSNSWCAGRKLTGRVLMTLAGGQVAYRLRCFSLGVAA